MCSDMIRNLNGSKTKPRNPIALNGWKLKRMGLDQDPLRSKPDTLFFLFQPDRVRGFSCVPQAAERPPLATPAARGDTKEGDGLPPSPEWQPKVCRLPPKWQKPLVPAAA